MTFAECHSRKPLFPELSTVTIHLLDTAVLVPSSLCIFTTIQLAVENQTRINCNSIDWACIQPLLEGKVLRTSLSETLLVKATELGFINDCTFIEKTLYTDTEAPTMFDSLSFHLTKKKYKYNIFQQSFLEM